MIMIKATKKPKKSVVNVKAAAPEPAQPAPVQTTAPVRLAAPVQSAARAQSAAPMQSAAPAVVPPPVAKPASPKPTGIAIELVEPAARQVFVAGSFNGWKPESTPLVPLGNGRWKGDLRLGPGRHEYLFVVDGQWRPDPNARESVENPFGGRNSVITVSE